MKVERALRLLPNLESLAPLRAMLLAAARADEQTLWSGSGPYLTVGKQAVRPDELGQRVASVLGAVTEHLREVYAAYVEALVQQERGAQVGAVVALRRAGGREERAGRLPQAHAWYEVALDLAAELPIRRPEIELLLSLSAVCRRLGRCAEGARHAQRAFTLAEAEFDASGAMGACEELGSAAVAQGAWGGAEAWYQRGLRLADEGGWAAAARAAAFLRRLAELALERSDVGAAFDFARRARERLADDNDAVGLARVLNVVGQVEAAAGRPPGALGAYREALAWASRAPTEASLEVPIRLNLAQLALDGDRYLEAEEELRRAERTALARGDARLVANVYVMLGRLRGRQGDERGFVFFEQALQTCDAFGAPPETVAYVRLEYGRFRKATGGSEEARAHLERARAIFESLGQLAAVEQVRAELRQLAA